MKPKFIFTTIAVALAAWNSSAQTIPGGYYRFERINFSLVVRQQGLTHLTYGPGVWTVKTMRMGNKEILKYLEEAFHTTWPAGAQLAVLTDTRDLSEYPILREIYVLDKDGNFLNRCDGGYYLNETNNACFRMNFVTVLKAGKYNPNWPVAETDDATRFQTIRFQLYRIEDDPSVYTDLQFQGFYTEAYHQKASHMTNTLSMSGKASLSGDGQMNSTWTLVSGRMSIAGKWVDVF